jgi:hypothetical protein
MGTRMKIQLTKEEEAMDAFEYLEHKKMQIIKGIESIADTGTQDDSTRLKAHALLLGKIMPDQTKLSVDVRSKAPYDALLDKLNCDKKSEK